VPEAGKKLLLGKLHYLAKQGSPSELDSYMGLSREGKRRFYWREMELDPKLSRFSAKEARRSSHETSQTTMRGWFGKEALGQMHGIMPGHPDYLNLLAGLVEGLPSRPHRVDALAKRGLLEYHCEHTGAVSVTERDEKSFEASGSADVEPGDYDMCKAGFERGGHTADKKKPQRKPLQGGAASTIGAPATEWATNLRKAMQLNTLAYQKTLDARKLKLQLEKKAAGKDSNFVAAAFVKDGNEERGINVGGADRERGSKRATTTGTTTTNTTHSIIPRIWTRSCKSSRRPWKASKSPSPRSATGRTTTPCYQNWQGQWRR